MKVSLNWLRELVELPPSVPQLVDLLTLAGVEVEEVINVGCAIPNVVVAQIRESVQHPNADRLSVCQVDDGSGAPRQIVCGAKNYKVGDKVPLALPGAKLSADFTIKVGKLRGVESQGMLCSADELGLPKGEDGLLILSPEAAAGTPIGTLFPGDTVLDLEVTPNRPDLLSVNGIAREIGALTGKPVKLAGPRAQGAVAAEVSLEIHGNACGFYSARGISGVKVGPSPQWLRQKLESVGLRSINNVVDVTNYVLMELGQPLHAFDADHLEGALQVRQAREGESLSALDGKPYMLAASDLVIADQARAVAIAGVMGGAESGVTEATVNLVLESAHFVPGGIRATSRRLGLGSDSSYRFERGVDANGILAASQRATELILEVAGGVAAETLQTARASNGAPVVEVPMELGVPHFVQTVPLRLERVEALLGLAVPAGRVEQILTGFGLEKAADGWRAPSFRPDLSREVDLIEEIARVVGMDAIPARQQARFAAASATDRAYDRAMALRRASAAHGLHEARSLTLVPLQPLGQTFTQVPPEQLQRVRNPMIDDQVVLRPNLLHGLLKAVGENIRAGSKSVRLFEIGRVYSTETPEERSHFALVLSGPLSERSWRAGQGREADIFDLKGVLCSLLGPETGFATDSNPALALSLTVQVGGKVVGHAGQLWPADARALDADVPVVFGEIDLDALANVGAAGEGSRKYREIARFPASTRDLALLAPLDLAHERIVATLNAASEPLLAGVELFDLFSDPSGEKVPADRRSLAYSLTYRSAERTLTAEEVNAAHGRLKEKLKSELPVSLRE